MATTLDQFVEELRRDVEAFRASWLKNHAEAPDMYPLELPADNDGLWLEMFTDFQTRQRAEGEAHDA